MPIGAVACWDLGHVGTLVGHASSDCAVANDTTMNSTVVLQVF
jgi:hypothetical protein